MTPRETKLVVDFTAEGGLKLTTVDADSGEVVNGPHVVDPTDPHVVAALRRLGYELQAGSGEAVH